MLMRWWYLANSSLVNDKPLTAIYVSIWKMGFMHGIECLCFKVNCRRWDKWFAEVNMLYHFWLHTCFDSYFTHIMSFLRGKARQRKKKNHFMFQCTTVQLGCTISITITTMDPASRIWEVSQDPHTTFGMLTTAQLPFHSLMHVLPSCISNLFT